MAKNGMSDELELMNGMLLAHAEILVFHGRMRCLHIFATLCRVRHLKYLAKLYTLRREITLGYPQTMVCWSQQEPEGEK